MKKIIVAFDIDGTLRCNCTPDCQFYNSRIIEIANWLKRNTKNVEVWAWSGGGKAYVDAFIRTSPLMTTTFGGRTAGKLDGTITPDIAIDDQHEFELGGVNIIIRAKRSDYHGEEI